jgi:hypothetical protein
VTHDRFEEMLARRSELTPGEEARLEAHLRECVQCRETAAAYERQPLLLRALPPVEPPPSLRAGVLAGIHTAPPRHRPWARPITLLGPIAAVLLVAGAVALHGISAPSRTAAPVSRPIAPTGAPTADTALSKEASRGATRPKTHRPPVRPKAGGHPVPAAGHSSSVSQSLPPVAAVPVPTTVPPSVFAPASVPTARPEKVQAPATHPPARVASAHPVRTAPPPDSPPISTAPVRQPTAVFAGPTPAPTGVPVFTAPTPIRAIPAETATPTATSTPQP